MVEVEARAWEDRVEEKFALAASFFETVLRMLSSLIASETQHAFSALGILACAAFVVEIM